LFIGNILYLADLKTGEIDPDMFSEVLGAAPKNLFSNRSKRFELAVFNSFGQIKKLLRLKS
jgi:hypothetical protein